MRLRPLASALLAAVLPALAGAAPPRETREARAGPLGLVIELRSDFGFERLARVEFTTGRRIDLNLNEGLSAALGVSFLPLAGGRLATRLTGGFKAQYLRASNGHAYFTGIPLELMEVAYAGPVRLGLGGSVLLEPRLRGEGFLASQTRDYDAAPGVVLDLEWLVSARWRTGVGVRGTYSWFTVGGVTQEGPAVGLVLRTDLPLVR